MYKKILIVVIAVFFSIYSSAQPYKNAAGIRAGLSSGLNFRHLTDNNLLFEGDALYNREGSQFSAMLGYQFTPHDKKRVYYYAGAGIFGGTWDEENAAGVCLVAGAEYVYRQVPLSMGVEWKPQAKIFSGVGFLIPDIGVTVRFVIN